MTAADVDLMAAFSRIYGPPRPLPPETPEARLRRLAEDDAAAKAADDREARDYFDGKALDARDERIVRGYLEVA